MSVVANIPEFPPDLFLSLIFHCAHVHKTEGICSAKRSNKLMYPRSSTPKNPIPSYLDNSHARKLRKRRQGRLGAAIGDGKGAVCRNQPFPPDPSPWFPAFMRCSSWDLARCFTGVKRRLKPSWGCTNKRGDGTNLDGRKKTNHCRGWGNHYDRNPHHVGMSQRGRLPRH